MMKGTALGAENREMNFMNNAHEKFYYEKLKEDRKSTRLNSSHP